MIIDSHCHIWARWPYQPPVPDPDSRASAGQLLYEMDQAGVGRAVVICARIGDNQDNHQHVAQMAAAHPGRLIPFADIDSRWSPSYRTAGAADRLAATADALSLEGFTYYLDEADDGSWLQTDEGRRLFQLAEARGLIASLSILPGQIEPVAALAAAFPRLPILLHHLAFMGPRTAATADGVRRVLAAADRLPNLMFKISGFGNVASPAMDFPYRDLVWIVHMLHEVCGPWRLVWGSDYPVSRKHMTYRQTLDMVRRHCGLPDASVEIILGHAMARLLGQG